MRRFCSFVCAIAVCSSVLTPATAEEKEKLRSGSVRVDLDGASIELLEARAVAVVPDPGCRVIGDFLRDIPAGSSRYRGNVYRIDSPVDLVQVQVELAFDVVPDSIVVSIHQKQANSSWTRYPPEDSEAIDSDLQVFVADAPGFGNPTFFTTGPLINPIPLEPGFDYAIGFAWTATNVLYSSDTGTYPAATPSSFDMGQVLGLVALNNMPPPLPDVFPFLQVSNVGAYSMQLCFTPVKGACCSSLAMGCVQRFESECMDAGSFFHGERSTCNEIVCEFGACCGSCGGCDADFTPQACTATGGINFWSGATCPMDPEALCPPVTGACCFDSAPRNPQLLCEKVCGEQDGMYLGDGTSIEPNPCMGACCVTDFGCSEKTEGSCGSFDGEYKGDGTTCATLPVELECGGACCIGSVDYTSCIEVPNRATCESLAFPETAYFGDATQCPGGDTPDIPGFCGIPEDYIACCLIDAALCVNTFVDECPDHVGSKNLSSDCAGLSEGCNVPVRACCGTDASCSPDTEAVCEASNGTWQRGALECTAGLCDAGACCGQAAGACAIRSETGCADDGGIFQGIGTNCVVPTDMCPGFEACCRSDGDCFDDLSSEECMTLAGNPAGTGSTCETLGGDCDDRGACCAVTGSCLFVLEGQCSGVEGIGGVFQGIGEACSSQTCPAGACCNDDETCDIRTEAGCTGAYVDDDTICEIDSCVIGACCVDDGCVADIRLIECDLAAGLFAGAGSTCDDVDACLSGACCKGNCTCEADVLGFECKAEGGRFNASLTCADVDCLPGIVSSDPANCFTDVRKAHDVDDPTVTYGPNAITLTINCDAQNITEGDLDLRVVPDGPLPTPITLIYDPNDDRVVTVEFASNLAAGLYLCVKHNLRGAEVCIGSTPGDLDVDGDVTAADVDELIARMPTGDPQDDPKDPMDPFTPATEPCDIDRSGACTPLDLLTEIDILNGAGEFDLLVEPYPACPTAGP